MYKKKIIIIAEAGVNHNGNLKKAKKLIDISKQSGANFIKFQIFKSEDLVTKKAYMAKYQIMNSKKKNKSQYDLLKNLELKEFEFIELLRYSKKKKINFLLSPFGLESVKFIHHLNMKYIKIPSGEITNLPLLQEIGRYKFKVFLSTGMSTIKEVLSALKALTSSGINKNNIYVLHCNSEYPTPYKDVNLNVLMTLKNLRYKIGYSDHTIGDHVAIASIAMGAEVIEKHVTLNKNSKGPDHSSSMEPSEFKLFVKKIREIEVSFGSNKKRPTPSEIKNLKKVRKSIYASKKIEKGEKFSIHNITFKRPFVKISPMEVNKFIGKSAKKNFSKDDLIQ